MGADGGADPGTDDSIVTVLDDLAETSGDRPFAKFPETELTVAEIAERSRWIAAGLSRLGVRKGDRVGVMLYNRPAFVEAFFGTLRTGAKFVPVNVSLKGEDLDHVLSDAAPTVMVVGPDCLDNYGEAAHDVEHRFGLEERRPDGADRFETLVAETEPPAVDLSSRTPASITYTSGTSGLPKGVVLPHGAYPAAGAEIGKRYGLAAGDTVYTPQPAFHINGQMVIAEALMAGVPFALDPWFSKSRFWRRVERYEATVLQIAGSVGEILYNETDQPDNTLRVASVSGNVELKRNFGQKFDCRIIAGYGLTESAGFVTFGSVDDPAIESEGEPIGYIDVAIVDQNHAQVPTGEQGEIVFRPTEPNVVFQRYHEAPDQTLETIENLWVHTGDVGYLDADGKLHFVERQSHFLRRKGENISVHEVERVLNDHPHVRKAIVVGVEAGLADEEVLAVIRTDAGAAVEPAALLDFCAERLAYFKVPRYVRFVEEFPTTESKGNVRRSELRDHGIDGCWDREAAGYELDR